MMTAEDAQDIMDWEDTRFEQITKERITGKSRWSLRYEQVYKDPDDNTFWMITWSRGATEHQDEGDENISFKQVLPVEVTTVVYKAID